MVSAVRAMMGMALVLSALLIWRVASHPSTTGRCMSMIMTSGLPLTVATATAPSLATATSWPRFSRRRFNMSQMVALSSTNKIRAM
jgi:hypothetical protein